MSDLYIKTVLEEAIGKEMRIYTIGGGNFFGKLLKIEYHYIVLENNMKRSRNFFIKQESIVAISIENDFH